MDNSEKLGRTAEQVFKETKLVIGKARTVPIKISWDDVEYSIKLSTKIVESKVKPM
jgi:hypothetical protein